MSQVREMMSPKLLAEIVFGKERDQCPLCLADAIGCIFI